MEPSPTVLVTRLSDRARKIAVISPVRSWDVAAATVAR
jgi:hypothetical protein